MTGVGDACPSWFALRVRSCYEKRVNERLASSGFASFLPTFEVLRHWSDRTKKIDRPLFPGYVFVRCLADDVHGALLVGGVVMLLPNNFTPAVIPEGEMDAVRVAVESKLPLSACDFTNGQKVKVEAGPLRGMVGVVQRVNGQRRLVVTLTMIGRSVSVHLDASDVVADVSTPNL